MFPILTVGDIHCSGKNPPARLDDLTKAQWKKIDYIVEIANYHKCPVVCTGDVFNNAVVANSLVSAMGERFNKLIEYFFFVFGNHDLQYHNLDMLEQTSLGVMWLNNKKVRHISEFEEIYHRPWSYIDWRSVCINANARYMLAHRAIVNDDLITKNSWILEDSDFCQHAKTLPYHELVLCGHWHRQYEYFYKDESGKEMHILNPGVICRRSVVEREMPSAWVVDIDNPDQMATRVDLNASYPSEVLREESLKSAIAPHAVEITRFVEQLKMNSLSKKVSFIDNLLKIMEEVGNKPGGQLVERELRDIIVTVKARKEKYQV